MTSKPNYDKFISDGAGLTLTNPQSAEGDHAAIGDMILSIEDALAQTGFTQEELEGDPDEIDYSIGEPTLHTLSQVQIIKSLGEALSWLEREMSWGVKPASLPHLTGRIGELYAAMVTRGQMALATNQVGYDIVTAAGEHVSVKTITTSTHVTFNHSTFNHVDRVMVLRLNFDGDEASIEEILDCTAAEAVELMTLKGSKYQLSTYKKSNDTIDLSDLKIVSTANHEGDTIAQYENATIKVSRGNTVYSNTIAALKNISSKIGVNHLNGLGNPKNTRSLGADVIKALKLIQSQEQAR
jgi:hypothetical protein